MKNLSSSVIASWLGTSVDVDVSLDGVKVDSRFVEKNDLFVCLLGERVDGHAYARLALEKGAACLLVDRHLDLDVPQIIVEDTLEALRVIAREYRKTLNAFFIGITGSNGKTSTKDILHAILPNSVATYKNQNTEIGTYLNLFRMDSMTEYGILEFGLDYEGDVALMSSIVEPDAALVMSLAPAHMANFNSIEHIASEKFMIFDSLTNDELGFYQGDFSLYRALASTQHSFGFDDSNEYVVSDVVLNNVGIDFKVNGVSYASNLLGKHQASNCAGVIALMEKMNIDDALIRHGLMNVGLTELRTEIVEVGKSLVLLDAYKSNASSTKYALDILVNYDFDGDKIAVLSDMVEMGEESLNVHLDVLNELARLDIKHVYTLGYEFNDALGESDLDASKLTNFDSFEALDAFVQSLFDTKQMILIKGSRSHALECLIRKEGK